MVRLCERRKEAAMAMAIAWRRTREVGGHHLQQKEAVSSAARAWINSITLLPSLSHGFVNLTSYCKWSFYLVSS